MPLILSAYWAESGNPARECSSSHGQDVAMAPPSEVLPGFSCSPAGVSRYPARLLLGLFALSLSSQVYLGTFKQGVSKQGVTILAWRPGSQYDVAATRGADCNVLASNCCAQFVVHNGTMSHLRDSTVSGLTARRDNALASKSFNANTPFLLPPSSYFEEFQHFLGWNRKIS